MVNVNNLIQGAGQIGNNGLILTNQAAGVINANDVNGNSILINANAATNQGLIEATGRGVLEFNVAVVNAGANIEAIGSTAFVELLSGATIRGGTLTNAGGTFETPASNGVTLDGDTQWAVDPGRDVHGTIEQHHGSWWERSTTPGRSY